jgi:uncharacterized Rmd1/YagE family protein
MISFKLFQTTTFFNISNKQRGLGVFTLNKLFDFKQCKFVHTDSKTKNNLTTLEEIKQLTPIKPRVIKKKFKKNTIDPTSSPTYKVKAIATADFYDLVGLAQSLENSGAYKVFEIGKLIPDTCLCVKPKYPIINEIEPRHMFFFEEGTCVFWNTTQEEQKNLLQLLSKHQENPHPIDSVLEESELMDYSRVIINKSTYINIETTTSYYENNELTKSFLNKHKLPKENGQTRFFNNHIYFSDYIDDKQNLNLTAESNHLLEKYAFSDAIALSVKLGIWEK